MARRVGQRYFLDQPFRLAVPGIDIDPIEAQRRGIPLQTMAQQMGIVLPAAQAFGQTTGTKDTTTQASGADTFGKIAGGVGTLAGAAAMIF
jgi:hypothetical protein